MVENAVEYAIFAIDADGSISSWNAGSERLFGYREDEITSKTFAVLFTEEDQAAGVPNEEMQKARAAGAATSDQWMKKADGSRFWVSGRLKALQDKDGNFQGFVKIVRDQTDRRALEELSSTDWRFREVIRQSPLSTFVSDADGRVKYINPAFTRLWGLTLDDLANYNSLEDEQAESLGVKPFIERAFAGEAVEFPPLCYDPKQTAAVRGGKECWIKTFAYPIKDADGSVVEVVTMHEDVSAKIKAETELLASKQNLALALKAGKAGTFEWNIKEDYNVWSPELEELYGAAPGTFGGNFDAWYTNVLQEDADRVVAALKEILARGDKEYVYEFRAVLPDGKHRWLAGRAHFIYDAEGNPEKMIGINFDITERKQVEEQLRRSREHYEAITLASSQIFWTTDANGAIVEDSPSWRAFTGQTYDEWKGYGWLDALHPDDREKANRIWREAVEKQTLYEVEYRIKNAAGEYRWTQARGVPIKNENGSIREWFGINADIHEQKQAEELLRAGEEFNRSVIASSPDCFKILDTEGRLQFMNEHGLCLMEIDNFVKFGGSYWIDFWEGDQRDLAAEAVKKAKRGETGKFQGSCKTAKGTLKWWDVVIAPVRDANGEISRLIAVSRDITENKRAEEEREDLRRREIKALKQSEIERRKLESLFKQAPAIINITRGSEHVFELIHPRMPELLGDRDYLHKSVKEVLPEPEYEPFIELMNKVYQTGETYTGSDTAVWLNTSEEKREGYFDFIYQAWRDINDEVGGVMSLAVEVTERVLARQEMERAAKERELMLEREQQLRKTAEDASRLKDEFLGTVSHELRTPLNAILGWSQMMRSGVIRSDQYEKAIETIDRNARSQAQLIDDLLDITRIITGKLRLNFEKTNFASVINSAVQTVRPTALAKNIQIFVNSSFEQADILADAERLQQIAWNLLSNAVKFTPKNGEVYVTLETKGSHLKFSVRDTGEGIEPDFLPYVFDRFSQADMSSTRRMGGLGLGLSIVRHLVEMHGGSIEVASEGKGKGAIFTVVLPVHFDLQSKEQEISRSTQYPDSAGKAPTARFDGVRILVVDDEPDACEVLKVLLEQCGATVLTAASANEALELVLTKNPHLLVSDIAMPDEDGYSLIKRVRALPKDQGGNIPAIALTAYASQNDRKKALEAGFQSHVTKPVDQNALINILTSFV